MPRTIRVADVEREGYLLDLHMKRRSDGSVDVQIEVREVDSDKGATVGSRSVVFTRDELQGGLLTSLANVFDQVEARIRARRYS